METRELHNLGRGVRKKKISALGRHMGSRGPRKTRELHSLVPAPPKKKKSTSTVKGSIERQLPPSKRSGRQTTKRGRLTRFTTGKKKKKKARKPVISKSTHGPQPQKAARNPGTRAGLDGKKITPSEAQKTDRHLASFNVTQLKDSVSAPICRYNKDR